MDIRDEFERVLMSLWLVDVKPYRTSDTYEHPLLIKHFEMWKALREKTPETASGKGLDAIAELTGLKERK